VSFKDSPNLRGSSLSRAGGCCRSGLRQLGPVRDHIPTRRFLPGTSSEQPLRVLHPVALSHCASTSASSMRWPRSLPGDHCAPDTRSCRPGAICQVTSCISGRAAEWIDDKALRGQLRSIGGIRGRRLLLRCKSRRHAIGTNRPTVQDITRVFAIGRPTVAENPFSRDIDTHVE